MAKISIYLSDELVNYLSSHVDNRSALIEALIRQWRSQQEEMALADACELVDELDLGWDSEWQTAAITDLEQSGL
jgi:Arc/MetJ-type ribon-helix-helix transcriptional regulator